MASHAKLSIYATENWSVWLLLEAEWASKACYRRKTWDTIYVMVLTSKTFYYRRIRVSRNKSVSEAALNAAILGNLPSSLQGHAGADVTHCLLNQTRLPFDMFPSMKIRSSNGSPVAYSESGKLLLLEVATYASKRAESNGRTKDCRSIDTRHAGSGPSICLKFYPLFVGSLDSRGRIMTCLSSESRAPVTSKGRVHSSGLPSHLNQHPDT